MIALDPIAAARDAIAAQPSRPATSMLLDRADARLVVFRIAPGQAVPPHRSDATVLLSVLAGSGIISGGDEERPCAVGDVIAFEPGELHGMRALDETLQLLAVITPRPGSRNAAPTTAAEAR
jgi:quercetin dioxygenase-like cupin family protein